jgi:type II secretory pathway pseudopilin PulG
MNQSIKLSAKGRTLLELCMALGLLGLLAGISTPEFAATRQLLVVKRITRQIEELTSQLTLLAQQHGEELILRESANRLRLTSRKDAGLILRQINLPKAISLNINTIDQRIIAYPSAVVSPGKITISNKKKRCSVTLSLWGRVRSSCQ